MCERPFGENSDPKRLCCLCFNPRQMGESENILKNTVSNKRKSTHVLRQDSWLEPLAVCMWIAWLRIFENLAMIKEILICIAWQTIFIKLIFIHSHTFRRQSGCAACEERWMYSLCGFEDSKNSILDSPSSMHSPAPICSPFTLRSPTRKMRNEALIEEGDEEDRCHTEAIGTEPSARSTRALESCQEGPHNTSLGGMRRPSNRSQASKQQLQGSCSCSPLSLACDGALCHHFYTCKVTQA